MSENPISEISDRSLQGIFKGAAKMPKCVVAFTVKDGTIWMQRRTDNFPIEAFEQAVKLMREDFDKEKNKQNKGTTNGNSTKT